ncbi:helix-turn-helix domain-containing protein [Rheinheimera maricola]|uniref:Helix-turn-helix transcriptional regulator n=1 Tax=Rheinheimera maricola TaxID=2793282 RepID=A0ABS7XBS3_9GAMM|nr:helix-turn-helix transcriptional regulator [Rheinheimera maricola]MBZ9613000.1 helix-turn-helix transcriptional regulator [Rheinheimera maricola]
MNQTSQLITALKRSLKAKGMSYRQLAEQLQLSEASVKRIFAQQNFTLSRLEQICRVLDTNLYELAKSSTLAKNSLPRQLSMPQEQALADDPTLLAYLYLLLNGWQFEDINSRYQLDELKGIRLLATLDRLKLIELQPHNKVRLLVARDIQWRLNGPVRRRHEQQIKMMFIDNSFTAPEHWLRLETAELSSASISILQRRLNQLSEQFAELAELDMATGPADKKGVGLLVALRPWVFDMVLAPPAKR